jgi:hypothetical protein
VRLLLVIMPQQVLLAEALFLTLHWLFIVWQRLLFLLSSTKWAQLNFLTWSLHFDSYVLAGFDILIFIQKLI